MTTQVNAPIDWRNPPPPTPDDRRIRLHELLDRTGFKSHRSIYDRIAQGRFPPHYKDGAQTFWWQSHLHLYNLALHAGHTDRPPHHLLQLISMGHNAAHAL